MARNGRPDEASRRFVGDGPVGAGVSGEGGARHAAPLEPACKVRLGLGRRGDARLAHDLGALAG
jgi:hypothetical protein